MYFRRSCDAWMAYPRNLFTGPGARRNPANAVLVAAVATVVATVGVASYNLGAAHTANSLQLFTPVQTVSTAARPVASLPLRQTVGRSAVGTSGVLPVSLGSLLVYFDGWFGDTSVCNCAHPFSLSNLQPLWQPVDPARTHQVWPNSAPLFWSRRTDISE